MYETKLGDRSKHSLEKL